MVLLQDKKRAVFYLVFGVFYLFLVIYGYGAVRVLLTSVVKKRLYWFLTLIPFVFGTPLRYLGLSLGPKWDAYLTGLLFAITIGLLLVSALLLLEDLYRLGLLVKKKIQQL